MAIVITKVGKKFTAEVSPPHADGVPWESGEPMDIDVLIRELVDRGCHPIDIGDELYKIDPKLIGL